MGGKPQARISNIAALQDTINRRGWNGEAIALPTANRMKRVLRDHNYKFSIVIPSDNTDNIKRAISSIKSQSTYKNYEIIVVTNSKILKELRSWREARGVVWRPYDKSFNFSDKCNEGASLASGEYVAFFNDDVRVITPDWIEALLEFLTLPGVGIVGPKLIYENSLIQHAGMLTGVRRMVGTAFHAYPLNTGAHFNFAQCVREASLICGALLAMPKTVFDRVGGFDAKNMPINHSDVDLCFKVRDIGLHCVYTPYATLMHIGHMSLAQEETKKPAFKKDKADIYLMKRWGRMLAYDPYFPPAMRDLLYIDSPEFFEYHPAADPCPTATPSSGKDVLVISHDLTGSGAPKVAFDIARLLKKMGNFVTVCSPVRGVFLEQFLNEGIGVVIDELILRPNADALAVPRNFDIIIANTIVCWDAVGELSRFADTFLYAHETELVYHYAQLYPNFKMSLSKAKGIWCGSQRSLDALASIGVNACVMEYGVDDAATRILPNPIKVSVFGSFEPRKGQDLAVLAAGAIPSETRCKMRMRLYGRTLDQSFRKDVGTVASEIPEVYLFSELAYADYQLALAESDIVLVCSRDDTLPLVSLDALALGKALICSLTTGTSGYLIDGELALLLKHNDPGEISDAIIRLVQDRDLREKIGRGARAVFERHFTYASFEESLRRHVNL